MSLYIPSWASHSHTLTMPFGLCDASATFQSYDRGENGDVRVTWLFMGNSSASVLLCLYHTISVLKYIYTANSHPKLHFSFSLSLFLLLIYTLSTQLLSLNTWLHLVSLISKKSNTLLITCLHQLFSDDQSNSNLSDNKASQASDEDEDGMVTEALQFNQLSMEEFCIILLSRVVTMFQGPFCTDSAIIEYAVNLLHKVLSLMTKVFPDDLWRGGTKLSSLMVSEDDTSTCIIMLVVKILLKITWYAKVLASITGTSIYNNGLCWLPM